MRRILLTRTALLIVAGLIGVLVLAAAQLPVVGAGALLHPSRRSVRVPAPQGCASASFPGRDVSLEGWTCPTTAPPSRGTLIYLHGIADNRTSGSGVIRRFTAKGFDVVTYDSRAHGESGGDACTYGYFEKEDLRLVMDHVRATDVVLVGTSLGAAVALQTASDPRVKAVVAAESFSALRSIAAERAPFVFTERLINKAFALVEQQAHFRVDDVSPLSAAGSIVAPVLVIHGEDDTETSPDHARRLFAALPGPKWLILVPGAGHSQSLGREVWTEIDRWIDAALAPAPVISKPRLRP